MTVVGVFLNHCLRMSVQASVALLLFSGYFTPAAVAQTHSEAATRRFQVVLRIVRPQWKNPLSPDKALHPHALTGSMFTVHHAESDDEFLQTLRAFNSFFTIERVTAKKVFTLRADQSWQMPKEFSLQQLWLAVVDKDKELLRNKMSNRPKATLSDGVLTDSSNPHYSISTKPPPYKFTLTETARQRLTQNKQLLLSYRLTQFYASVGKPVQYMESDMVQFMKEGDTVCLGIGLPVLTDSTAPNALATPPTEKLILTDIIFATVTELTPAR